MYSSFIENDFDKYKEKIFFVRNVVIICGIVFTSSLFVFDPYFDLNQNLFDGFKLLFYLGLVVLLIGLCLLIKFKPTLTCQNYYVASFFLFLGTAHALFYLFNTAINDYYHNLGFILIVVYFNLFLFLPMKLNLPVLSFLFILHGLIYYVADMPSTDILLLMSLTLAITGCCLFINHLITKGFLDNAGYLSKAIKLAYTDELTELNNRRAFNFKINNIIKHQNYCASFAMLIIDLDNFKQINDSYGHDVGDKAIQKLAKILKEFESNSRNIVARLGGDEFILFMNDYNLDEVKVSCHNLLQAINQIILGDATYLKTSIGVAFVEEINVKDLKASSMLKLADKALYKLKRSGKKNRFWIYRFNQPSQPVNFPSEVTTRPSDSVTHH